MLTRSFVITAPVWVAAGFAAGGGLILRMVVADRIQLGSHLSIDERYGIMGLTGMGFAAIGCFTIWGPYRYLKGKQRRRN